MTSLQGLASRPDAPRSGAPVGAPSLDISAGNGPISCLFPSWNRKQWAVRRTLLDRMRLWSVDGLKVLWVTLTSAPGSNAKRLRDDFAVLRHRMEHEFGFGRFEYVCVDTREGHGVLHMLWACKSKRFYIPQAWLSRAWADIHGAAVVDVRAVGKGDGDARRLSRYMVTQYCAGQDALVRMSQSRARLPLAKVRQACRVALRNLPERWEWASHLFNQLGVGGWHAVFRRGYGNILRDSVESLMWSGSCVMHGRSFAWLDGDLWAV